MTTTALPQQGSRSSTIETISRTISRSPDSALCPMETLSLASNLRAKILRPLRRKNIYAYSVCYIHTSPRALTACSEDTNDRCGSSICSILCYSKALKVWQPYYGFAPTTLLFFSFFLLFFFILISFFFFCLILDRCRLTAAFLRGSLRRKMNFSPRLASGYSPSKSLPNSAAYTRMRSSSPE